MIAMIISFFVVFISFNFFMISYEINGVNRIVLSAPLSLYETAIELFNIDEDEGPHFNKTILEDNITSYFDFHLPRYVNDYDLDFYYYNPSDHSLDMDSKCQAVEVTVSMELVLNTHYQKTMFYEIRSQ